MFGFGKQQPQKKQQQVNNDADNKGDKDTPKTGVDKFAFLLENSNQANDDSQQPAKPLNIKELFANEEFTGSLRQHARTSALKSLSDEVKQGIADGNPESLIEALSSMAEAIYMQAIQDTSNLQSAVLDQRLVSVKDETSDAVKSGLREHQINQAIPQLNNPILRLGVQSFMDKLQEQDPSMSPDDMRTQVNDYLATLGKEFGVMPDADKPASDTEAGVDWFSELGIEPPEPV